MRIEEIEKIIRNVPDFPKKGIQFKDLTTVFKDKDALKSVADKFEDKYKDLGITKVVGIESRGFILGSILADRLDAGMSLIRKKGKLPADVYSETYDLEYGGAEIEIHKDALNEDDVVLIHDDLLATGGTMKASLDLVKRFNVKKVYISFIVDLTFLNGKDSLKGEEIYSLIEY